MAENLYLQKLANAILYFAKETQHLNMTKLFKLLSFYEFDFFSETGYPSIGLEYQVFQRGPVPKKLWIKIKEGDLPPEITDKVLFKVKDFDFRPDMHEVEILVRHNKRFDNSVFSPRELKILEKLAFIYKDATASQMSEISHEDHLPWKKAMEKNGLYSTIDYLLAIDDNSDINPEQAEEMLKEHNTIVKIFGMEPLK